MPLIKENRFRGELNRLCHKATLGKPSALVKQTVKILRDKADSMEKQYLLTREQHE